MKMHVVFYERIFRVGYRPVCQRTDKDDFITLPEIIKKYYFCIMRLSEIEKSALRAAVGNMNGAIYLYGSRIDDDEKGGDIDILIIPDTDEGLQLALNIQKNFFLNCEQKLDVLIYRNNDFCNQISQRAIKIYDHGTFIKL